MSASPYQSSYVGRFAPSPSGPLHAGSLAAALASYLDARVHHGRWLLRIEDVDETRTVAGAADAFLIALQALGMHWDGPVIVQSTRKQHYQNACEQLGKQVYPCACSRKGSAAREEPVARSKSNDAIVEIRMFIGCLYPLFS